jgi:hypothetical protein
MRIHEKDLFFDEQVVLKTRPFESVFAECVVSCYARGT